MHQRLGTLQSRLEQVNSAWTHSDHEKSVMFLVEHIPRLMNAERCSIFIFDPNSDTIWVKYGTGLVEKQIEAPREGSFVGQTIITGKTIIKNDLEQVDGFHAAMVQETQFITRNMICTPIRSLISKNYVGAIQVLNRKNGTYFSTNDTLFLRQIVKYLSYALENARLNREILTISNMLYKDIALLKQECAPSQMFITKSEPMIQLLETVHKVSKYPINIHIYGESGTGKELISRMLHRNSDFKDSAFVAVNCSSIPENLMESEFFGHEKGAFTGAVSNRPGRFEEAKDGTLFLDEVGDMPLLIQPKFLRAIQEMEGSRIGSSEMQKYHFRIISASSKNLRHQVESGTFREDLLFRLFAIELYIPPLRERKEDIVPLAMMFLENTCCLFQKKVSGFSREVIDCFESFPWPGNVRQLQREVERAVALTPEGSLIRKAHCSAEIATNHHKPAITEDGTRLNLEENKQRLEKQLIQKALKRTGGRRLKTAELLGITRQTLHSKMKVHGIG